MNQQETPRDLKFVALFFAGAFLILLFVNGGSTGRSLKLLLLSIPASLLGVAIYKLIGRSNVTWPKSWPEWILLYFIGLLIGGLILIPVRLALNW